jgi:hypothetical protein
LPKRVYVVKCTICFLGSYAGRRHGLTRAPSLLDCCGLCWWRMVEYKFPIPAATFNFELGSFWQSSRSGIPFAASIMPPQGLQSPPARLGKSPLAFGFSMVWHDSQTWTLGMDLFLKSLTGICTLVNIIKLFIISLGECIEQGFCIHCKEDPIYVFLEMKLRGLVPNFHIHVSVSNLYIPRIGPHISCSRKGISIAVIYKSLTDTCMWKLGLWPRNSFLGIFVSNFRHSVFAV